MEEENIDIKNEEKNRARSKQKENFFTRIKAFFMNRFGKRKRLNEINKEAKKEEYIETRKNVAPMVEQENDIDIVMKIWLDTNIKTHNYIDSSYWIENYNYVKDAILNSEVYVYVDNSIPYYLVKKMEISFIGKIFASKIFYSFFTRKR